VPPAGGVSASYDVDAWPGGYVVTVKVRNTGGEPLSWTARIELPSGASVTSDWEAERSTQDGVWVFTPDRSPLAPGATYKFGFTGQRGSGDFPLICTVNGVACQGSRQQQ
jgi:cellulase/cellobiase CelA1